MDNIAVIGLGYVGLPLAKKLSENFDVIGFDVSSDKVDSINQQLADDLAIEKGDRNNFSITCDHRQLSNSSIFIVAVPTPVDQSNRPDLRALESASSLLAPYLTKGDMVIYESTVYPGCTREVCLPLLEEGSGLTCDNDFYVGYSPERINPGDKSHELTNIIKVIAATSEPGLEIMERVYGSVIDAGLFRASTLEVAEAAKVIENTQRDLNIGLMNELSIICEKLNIDFGEVLAAAETKWNFLRFKPGLVGGHCIGVDPYYLIHKAESVGYKPDVILSGRRVNDGMGTYVAQQTLKRMAQNGVSFQGASVAIFGAAFKENCADFRNSKVIDIIDEVSSWGINCDVIDPVVDADEFEEIHNIKLKRVSELEKADAIIVAVAHDDFQLLELEVLRKLTHHVDLPVIVDVKRMFDGAELKSLGFHVFQL